MSRYFTYHLLCLILLFIIVIILNNPVVTIGNIDKTMPTHNAAKKPTKAEKHECKRIYKEWDHLIPGQYSKTVQEKLAAKGIERTIIEITNARLLNRYDLDVMLILEELAKIEKEKLEAKLSGSFIEPEDKA